MGVACGGGEQLSSVIESAGRELVWRRISLFARVYECCDTRLHDVRFVVRRCGCVKPQLWCALHVRLHVSKENADIVDSSLVCIRNVFSVVLIENIGDTDFPSQKKIKRAVFPSQKKIKRAVFPSQKKIKADVLTGQILKKWAAGLKKWASIHVFLVSVASPFKPC